MEAKNEKLTDREIVDNLTQDRDMDRTIKYLYRAYFEFTGHFVVNNSGSWTDAEDTFQEVVVSFIHLVRAGRFRGEASIKTFLYALNRNTWLNELKCRDRSQKRETKYEAARPAGEDEITRALEYREANSGLMKLFDELGETCKKILLLFYFENRSMKEILTELHYENDQVVRNKKHKCLKKLEGMIQSNKNLYQQLKNFLHG